MVCLIYYTGGAALGQDRIVGLVTEQEANINSQSSYAQAGREAPNRKERKRVKHFQSQRLLPGAKITSRLKAFFGYILLPWR